MPWKPTTPERDSLVARLHHPDVAQLLFQVNEIFDERIYLRHSVDVSPGATVLDVGANVGVTAAFFSHECGAARVHSFEPVPATYLVLEANVSSFDGCVSHNYGLSDESRAATIAYYPHNDGMSTLYEDREADEEMLRTVMGRLGLDRSEIDRRLEGRDSVVTLEVELRTLADVFVEYELAEVDLLKIDVERAELDVLRGMASEDWPKVRQVVAEVHDHNLAPVVALLDDRGFAVALEQEAALHGTPLHMVYATR